MLSKLSEYHPSGNLKLKNLGIFQVLKLRNLMGNKRRYIWLFSRKNDVLRLQKVERGGVGVLPSNVISSRSHTAEILQLV